jgi:hypothetical protein
MSQFKEILVFGDSRFLGDVYAKKFIGVVEGDLYGNADTAIKARQDIHGRPIDSTYIMGVSNIGTDIVFTRGNGSTFSINTQEIKINVVDNLESESPTDALSANMGRQLESEVEELRDASTWSTY